MRVPASETTSETRDSMRLANAPAPGLVVVFSGQAPVRRVLPLVNVLAKVSARQEVRGVFLVITPRRRAVFRLRLVDRHLLGPL